MAPGCASPADFDPLGHVLDSLDAMQEKFETLERHSPVLEDHALPGTPVVS